MAMFKDISIHALREEGDALSSPSRYPHQYFYPRPPRGGRPYLNIQKEKDKLFLSTPSARRATSRRQEALYPDCISIHALREEGDGICSSSYVSVRNFYPRPPRGGRPDRTAEAERGRKISIHALREEGDCLPSPLKADPVDFYPRPPRGGRQQKQRENPPLLSHYIPLCTNCKEVPVKQTAKSHRYLCKRLVFRCEASGKTMCAACSHWRGIKRSAHYPAQTPGAAQHARP